MFKYIVTFSKTGTICYTSHLDLMRMFKRTFKKAGIKLSYSQGFNPHPKMGFAQPLSLGYTGLREFIELETTEDYKTEFIKEKLTELMPEGLEILDCRRSEGGKKTLAALTTAALYGICIPLESELELTDEEIKNSYMSQERITALKKQKKKKEPVEIDIKPMIRNLEITNENDMLKVDALLDSGSISNLSPELLITTLKKHFDMSADRSEIEVTRKDIYFQ